MPITLKTDGFERVVIAANGKVGIGTAQPTGNLHIAGPGNQYVEIVSTDPQGSGTRLMSVTSNQVKECMQFLKRFYS